MYFFSQETKMNRWFVATAAASVLIVSSTVCSLAQEKAPAVVTTPVGQAPSDAIALFDGKDLSEWTTTEGKPAGWVVKDGTMTVKGGGIMTKKEFGSMQLHVEFMAPNPPKGTGQDRGNSGIYLQGRYECQVLDSYQNETYYNGMASAIYLQYAPLVNAARKPGEWQSYDIIFHAPVFDSKGAVLRPARVTTLWNGVLVQDNVEIKPTPGGIREGESPRGPIFLQDHNHPVKFRNMWVRELQD
jgi:hypothetical protein